MNRRAGAAVCVVVLAAGALASCGGSGGGTLDRDEFIARMTSDGIPVEQATCIADGLDAVDIEVDKTGNPSEDDDAEATEIATQCFAAAAGMDPSPIPDLDSTTTVGS